MTSGNTQTNMEEKIKEINKEFSKSIEFWQNVMMEASTGWGINLNFTNRDAFNAIYIMNAVLSNIAIKSGFITNPEEAEAIGKNIKEVISKMYGIKTDELI